MNTPFGAVAPQPQEHARLLEKFEINKLLELAERVKPTLSKPYHLKPKTEDDLKHHIELGGKIMGVFDGNHALIGSAVLVDSNNTHFDVAEYSIPELSGSKILIQMFLIAPEKQGNGVSKKLMEAIEQEYPNAHFVSKVAVDNTASLGVFSDKKGFLTMKTVTSTTPDGAVYDSYILCKENKGLVPAPACTATPV